MPLTAGQTFGVNAGTSAISAGFGILGSYLSNKWARENADHDREENYKLNEMSAENADARTRALYADLYSPSAQLQQLRDAGLSPSVFFANGAGGISGSTGAQGEGASGIKQQTFGIPNISPIDMSQIELNKANARKLNADARILEGSTNEQIRAWFLDNENRSLRNEYMNWQNTWQAMQNNMFASYGEEEMKTKLANLSQQTKLLVEQTRSAAANADVDQKTVEERVNYIQKQNVLLIADIALKKSQTQLNEANVKLSNKQVWEITERLAQNKTALGIKQGELDFHNKELQAQIEQWAKENGFESNRQTMAIIQMFLNFSNEQKEILVDAIDAFIPF